MYFAELVETGSLCFARAGLDTDEGSNRPAETHQRHSRAAKAEFLISPDLEHTNFTA